MLLVPTPMTGEYWVAGHAQRTGVYSLTARRITLKQAIDGAGGFDALAVPSRTEIIRRIGKDKEVFANVDMDKVYAGMQPDIFLKPNDQVRVGTAAWAPFLAAARNGFRITYGFGFLYDRNFAPQQKQQQ
jgi:protein involved in polysaccharide export with SLBB domain